MDRIPLRWIKNLVVAVQVGQLQSKFLLFKFQNFKLFNLENDQTNCLSSSCRLYFRRFAEAINPSVARVALF